MHLLRIYKYIVQSLERTTSIGGSMATSPAVRPVTSPAVRPVTSPAVRPVNVAGGSIGAGEKDRQL
jgi:hypothetical protein